MKLLVVIFLNLLLFQFCFGQEDKFYETVLNDFGIHSAFISLKVESDNYKGKAVINNAYLYFYLHETRAFDEASYKKFVKSLLLKNKNLKLKNFIVSESGDRLYDYKEKRFEYFRIVKESDEVNKIAVKGKEEFINYYFHNPVGSLIIKRDVSDWNPVINKLFEWKIAVKIDDESGFLFISDY